MKQKKPKCPFTERLLVLAGPTASGKTEVAYAIAKRVDAELISCDSMQVYRSMSVTTQAPRRRKTGSNVRLVAFIDPAREYSAALFRRDAEKQVLAAFKKKKTPVVVGGTGLYLRALLSGLFEPEDGRPSHDESLRRAFFKDEADAPGSLHQRLQKVDAAAAARIHPNDTRRLVRALEVFELTGKPLSAQKENRSGLRDRYPMAFFLLDRQRQDLYERINRRVEGMLTQGLVPEVRRLSKRKLSKTASMALGVREMKSALSGERPVDEAVELLKKNTRNYAKRQLSWFRAETGVRRVEVAPGEKPSVTAAKIIKAWRETA